MKRSFQPTREQRKLLMSLVANFATRVPGVLGVVFFLPLLRFSLGTENYSLLLASLSLGAAAGFLFGGIGTVARRLIGEAHGRGDLQGEADGFQTIVRACLATATVSILLGGSYAATQNSSAETVLVALLPIVTASGGMFDNIRVAYNEQYVTSVANLVLQTLFYSIGFAVPAVRADLVLAAVVLVGSSALASLIGLALLLRERPHLLHGRAKPIVPVIRQGLAIAFADGMLLTALSGAVVVMQATESANVSAWFATLVRLFWTLLTPVTLVLLPFSGYVRLIWAQKTRAQQYSVLQGTLVLSVGYAVAVVLALFLLSKLYINGLLKLSTPGEPWEVIAIFAFFGAIIVFKSYANLAYVVLDAQQFSMIASVGLAAAAVVAGLSGLLIESKLAVIAIYSAAATLSIATVLFDGLRRFRPRGLAD